MMKRLFLLGILISFVTTLYSQTREDKYVEVGGCSFAMVYVEGGSFVMGAPNNDSEVDADTRPAHKVTLSSYYIGKYEVSQRLWEAVMGSDPSTYKNPMPDNEFIDVPVHDVSWEDCQVFVKKLSKMTGQNFRLPTEAEWEFAARGGKKSKGYKYAGSNSLGEVAYYDAESPAFIGPSRPRRGNELGIYDMTGNVDEWCQDWYAPYTKAAQVNPKGPKTGSYRVLRGGSFFKYNKNWKVYERMKDGNGYSSTRLGLRLVLSVQGNASKTAKGTKSSSTSKSGKSTKTNKTGKTRR